MPDTPVSVEVRAPYERVLELALQLAILLEERIPQDVSDAMWQRYNERAERLHRLISRLEDRIFGKDESAPTPAAH